jgi:hypothetical protein
MNRTNNRVLLLLRNQTGSSLVFALIVSFMLITFVTVAVHFSNTELKSASKQEKQISAYYIAEAGIERAIQEINQSLEKNEEPDEQFEDPNFEGGSYITKVTANPSPYYGVADYTITSTGTYNQEKKTITQVVDRPLWSGNDPDPDSPFNYAIYADDTVNIWGLSSLLHPIKVIGDVHADNAVGIRNVLDLFKKPTITGIVSTKTGSNINVPGLEDEKKKKEENITHPTFDFDKAAAKAKENGIYIPHWMIGISLLGLSPGNKVIFVDGDCTLIGLDLLGLSFMDLTLVVNGSFTTGVSLGTDNDEDKLFDFANSKLNIIAKDGIFFGGLLSGMQVNGILYSQQGDITVLGHLEVDGYMGANKITVGSELLGDLTSLLSGSGSMRFEYNPEVFKSLPSGIGFEESFVNPKEQGSTSE